MSRTCLFLQEPITIAFSLAAPHKEEHQSAFSLAVPIQKNSNRHRRAMQVFVDLCGTGLVAAHVTPRDTLADLKARLLPSNLREDDAFFSYGGKPLPHSGSIASLGIRSFSTVHLRIRAPGGGGDGGATGAESRDCYLNMYAVKKPDKVDPNEARLAKWSRCALSSEALKPPCVIDMLGNLYNKEALVSVLLAKSLPKELRYIKGLKDMISIHLTSVPGISPDDEISHTKFLCPISSQEFNGKYKFYVLRTCGHVLSARALKEVQSSSCLVCFTPFVEKDKLVINGTEEEVEELRQRMEEEVASKLREKKDKKVKNGHFDPLEAVVGPGGANKDSILVQKTSDLVDELAFDKVSDIKRKVSKQSKLHIIEKPKEKPTKRFRAVDMLPDNATKEVYASIFSSSSSKPKIRETYSCRALPLGRN